MSIPVMLKLENRRCVVIGGGKVGSRQARKFLEAGAEVVLISPSLKEEISGVQHIQARYSPEMLPDLKPFLVVAATNHEAVNQQICEDAARLNILTMRVDSPNDGDVKGIMAVEAGDIQITVSSGTPLLSRYLLNKFSGQLTPEMLTFANWLKSLRPHVRKTIKNQPDRAALWERIFDSPVMSHVEAGDLASARAVLIEILGAELPELKP